MNFLNRIESQVTRLLPTSLGSLVLRLGLSVPFWLSGLTKWDGFGKLSDTPVLLFTEEFKLHILGNAYSYPFPLFVAYASSIAEILFPILLVLGLFTRLAGLALLAMTVIIQLTIPDGWPIHLTWAAMALGVIALGGGRLSLDRLLRRV